MITITLKDGTKIENLTLNGNNFVSDTKLNESLFTSDNTSDMTVSDGTTDTKYTDMLFTQQMEINGKYYICFHRMSDKEIYNSKITNLELALAELAETSAS